MELWPIKVNSFHLLSEVNIFFMIEPEIFVFGIPNLLIMELELV